ncbi:major facilitator superfamily domain-containing protein 1-like isoform X2 [Corticium candelabrum]|uniref:major facilitator superfamily domain-containing protein 1-like isoform X2 n=1 Tax=Corticium candelabrum TaxID=121492 RepID=UPI002E276791|nr:major facilitator superfamily domain-containing protein 1-like isoform X2 [Corticium candelabrum]
MDARKTYYRFVILFFTCLLTFGSYFCFDMPSVLQKQLERAESDGGLGLSGTQYNLLYAIYAWTNAVMVLLAGFMIDKLGNRFGLFLFSFMCVLGSSVFSLGATFNLFPIMLLGRLIFGTGNGSLTVVQNRVSTFWFKGKELALAFGFTLSFSRLGSVLNFLLTDRYAQSLWPDNPKEQVVNALWTGSLLCGLGFVSAAVTASLDERGMEQLGRTESTAANARRVNVRDIFKFSLLYWLVALAIMFFYNGIFAFIADASLFIQDKYGFSADTSSIIAGGVYDVSLVLAPFCGLLVDCAGRRGVLILLCLLLTVPVFALLAFTCVYPLIPILWLGMTYSIGASSLWPSIPLIVPLQLVGTAMGVATTVQMVGIGICNIVVGKLEDLNRSHQPDSTPAFDWLSNTTSNYGECSDKKPSTTFLTDTLTKAEAPVPDRNWTYIMIFLFGNIIVGVVVAIFLNIRDAQTGFVLNRSRAGRQAPETSDSGRAEDVDSSEESDDDETAKLLPNIPFDGRDTQPIN